MFVIIVLYGFEISSSVHALDDSNFKEVVVNINLLWWFLSHELLGTNFLLLLGTIAYYYQIGVLRHGKHHIVKCQLKLTVCTKVLKTS
jgi:hypothetical protein